MCLRVSLYRFLCSYGIYNLAQNPPPPPLFFTSNRRRQQQQQASTHARKSSGGVQLSLMQHNCGDERRVSSLYVCATKVHERASSHHHPLYTPDPKSFTCNRPPTLDVRTCSTDFPPISPDLSYYFPLVRARCVCSEVGPIEG